MASACRLGRRSAAEILAARLFGSPTHAGDVSDASTTSAYRIEGVPRRLSPSEVVEHDVIFHPVLFSLKHVDTQKVKMSMSKRVWCRSISLGFMVLVFACGELMAQSASSQAPRDTVGSCDGRALEASEDAFLRLVRLRRDDPGAVTNQDLRAASAEYIVRANGCYDALYGSATLYIDDGGMLLGPTGSEAYNLPGLKWGAGSPYAGGVNGTGPRLPGGTVTYSFMASGISMGAEGANPSLAFSSLPTFAPCFVSEITNAFAAWSAVANIRFTQVGDNGLPFDAAGASGDIRIAAHTFDGPYGILAHAWNPPPNGTSASGDLHFDRSENWSCTAGPGVIDIGIVAVHEIGHAIGLNHETANPAIMQPSYNPAVTMPLADDINGATQVYGAAPPRPRTTLHDFDGDHKTDLTVWRPSTGIWWENRSNGTVVNPQWGAGFSPYNDVTVSADYDGDGKSDVAVWRSSTGDWFIIRSSDGGVTFRQWGAGGDVPVPADYDGDGKADMAVYRPSNGYWLIIRSSDGGVTANQWGAGGDVPVPADYDGDGKADMAVWRPSSGYWFIVRSSDGGAHAQQWGAGNDVLVPADYDGDGKADMAVWRPSSGYWFIIRSSDGGATVRQWGAGDAPYNDVAVPGDYDGDGKTDIAVWRSSTGDWFIIRSSDGGVTFRQWGAGTDIPIPRAKIQ